MREIKNKLFAESPRQNKSKLRPRRKSFGYQVLGFGSGGLVPVEYNIQYLIVAGGGGAGKSVAGANCGGGGAGGFRTLPSKSHPVFTLTDYPVTVGQGGAGGAAPVPNPPGA